MDIEDIKSIIDLMKQNSLTEFELEKEGFKIKLKRGLENSGKVEIPLPVQSVCPNKDVSQLVLPELVDVPEAPVLIDIKAPMVGTFYLAPSPESAPFVEKGTQVNPDSLVCIIEAMKVMNEIKAEVRGTVEEIIATNGRPVEFGQTLLRIRPN